MYQGTKYIKVPPVEPPAERQRSPPTSRSTGRARRRSTACRSPAPTASPCRGAEFSLGVVDEAIYAIRRDTTQDPLAFFFGHEWNMVHTEDSLNFYFNGEAGKRRMRLARCATRRAWRSSSPTAWCSPRSARRFPIPRSGRPTWSPTPRARRRPRSSSPIRSPPGAPPRAASRRYQGGRRHREDHRAQESDPAAGGAALLRAGRRDHDLRAGAQLSDHRKDGARLAGCEGPGRDGRRHARCPRAAARRSPRWIGGCARSRCACASITGKALTDEESDALELELPVNIPGVKLSQARGGSLTAGGSARLRSRVSRRRCSPARGCSASAFRLRSRARSSARSIT